MALKFAILGAGRIGQVHAKAIQSNGSEPEIVPMYIGL